MSKAVKIALKVEDVAARYGLEPAHALRLVQRVGFYIGPRTLRVFPDTIELAAQRWPGFVLPDDGWQPRRFLQGPRTREAAIVRRCTLTRVEASRHHDEPCVYMLIHFGRVDYVGKSRPGYGRRHRDHACSKRFERVVALNVRGLTDRAGNYVADIDTIDRVLWALEGLVASIFQPTQNAQGHRPREHIVKAWRCHRDFVNLAPFFETIR